MHLYRWLTSIVAAPLLVYIVFSGSRRIFYALLFAASVKGLLEVFHLIAPQLPSVFKIIGIILNFFFFYFLWQGLFYQAFAMVCLWVIIPLSFCLFSSPTVRGQAAGVTGSLVMAFLYICLPLGLLVVIDRHPKGNLWILFLLTVIFISDTGAFYFGRFFGKRKLYPSVSPNKTWAGAVGGLLVGVLSGLFFSYLFRLGGFPLQVGLLAGSLSICGQVGDLVESMIKRNAGVKDTGRILPGHGGILDRVDGVLFASPLLYLYISWFTP
ncbi:MAG: phosphatidate cytidylyltransferase [Deltaproteobacteria bacterium]|nr:phosphatidate cytidylyltransferase [Deltaproteobacteria bacterium]